MAFNDVIKVEDADFYLDVAFRRGKGQIALARQAAKGPKIEKSKTIELERLKIVRKNLIESLDRIGVSFPSFDSMPEFYRELTRVTIDYAETKKALGAVAWARQQVDKLYNIYVAKIKRAARITDVNRFRREFYGRVSSVLKQIKHELKELEKTRRIMRTYPTIKTNLFTIALFGFPNVGKSTLLAKLSPSKPEIAAYPFTTKCINIGYAMHGTKKIQIIDTPGTLNRFDKMNNIEKQAFLAIKHVANVIVYIFDLTEEYPLADQKKLLTKIEKLDKPIIVYLSKADILDEKIITEFKNKNKNLEIYTDSEKIKDYFLSAS